MKQHLWLLYRQIGGFGRLFYFSSSKVTYSSHMRTFAFFNLAGCDTKDDGTGTMLEYAPVISWSQIKYSIWVDHRFTRARELINNELVSHEVIEGEDDRFR